MLDFCRVIWEGLTELRDECRHHGPPSLCVLLLCVTALVKGGNVYLCLYLQNLYNFT